MKDLFTLPENIEEIEQIIGKIDYTAALDPNATAKQVAEACEIVKRYGFATVCVYPTWVKLAKERMKGSNQGILVTVGFPHGSTSVEAKTAEAEQACLDGATEVDMVINIARMLDGDYEYVKNDISSVVSCCRKYQAGVKVIIETGYLTDEQKCKAAEIAVESGAEYIKTCTGFGPGRATLHDVLLLKSIAGNRAEIKASGGITCLEEQWMYIQAGASRVAGRGIILEQLKRMGYEK